MVVTVKKQISLIVLMSMLSSAFQPSWSMEVDADSFNSGQKRKREEPRKAKEGNSYPSATKRRKEESESTPNSSQSVESSEKKEEERDNKTTYKEKEKVKGEDETENPLPIAQKIAKKREELSSLLEQKISELLANFQAKYGSFSNNQKEKIEKFASTVKNFSSLEVAQKAFDAHMQICKYLQPCIL